MGNTTDMVRQALTVLGWDAPDKDVKAYLRERGVPEGQIALALKKIRAKGRPPTKRPPIGS